MQSVPIHQKVTLTIQEAAEYSNIGTNKIEDLLQKPNCPFVLYIGTQRLIKHKELKDYIGQILFI